MYPTVLLFVAPKQGGILQSSGFLNLKSLMSLGLTCKAHALDELSLILLIENEITRNHQVSTMEEAIHFLKRVCQRPLLRQWIAGNRTGQSISLTRQLLFEAVCYDVMLVKMLRAIPESFRSQFLNHQRNEFESTLLHRAALSDNPESIKALLAFYPESQRIQALSEKDRSGSTVLHCAAISGNTETIQTVLSAYPESQRFDAVCAQDRSNQTVLHYAAISGSLESVQAIFALYPESRYMQAVTIQDTERRTVLHYAAYSNPLICHHILSLLPESLRVQIVEILSVDGETALHLAAESCDAASVKTILSLCPESERWHLMSMMDQNGKTVLELVEDEEALESIMELLPKLNSSAM